MTQEEKAKAYDEALEKAKELLDSPRTCFDIEQLKDIFSELAESEGEKTRKELLEEIESIIPHEDETDSEGLILPSYHTRIDRYKSYLEKQKEQEHICDSAQYEEGFKTGYELGLRKQKEQKPNVLQNAFDKSKKDYTLEEKSKASDYAESILPTSVIYGESEEEYKLHTIIEAAFIAGQKEQKSTEWSDDYREEDIQTRFAFYTYKDDPSTLYLSNVFVEESTRNHGFGTRILKAAEKVAETIGAITISLKVKQDSPANAWYRKNGYGYVAFEDGYDWLEKTLEYMKPNKQECALVGENQKEADLIPETRL